jgi:hypothetical protein
MDLRCTADRTVARVRAREEVVRPMRGLKTCSHGGVDIEYSVETDVCNEVWMVVIARNLVRSLCR